MFGFYVLNVERYPSRFVCLALNSDKKLFWRIKEVTENDWLHFFGIVSVPTFSVNTFQHTIMFLTTQTTATCSKLSYFEISKNVNKDLSHQWRTQKISEGGKISSQSYDVTNQLQVKWSGGMPPGKFCVCFYETH